MYLENRAEDDHSIIKRYDASARFRHPERMQGLVLGFAAALALTLTIPAAYGQQRTFINGGFEENDPQGPGAPTFQIFPNTAVVEWNSNTGVIELWDSNFLSVPAHEGDVFAELNANSPGYLYQDICLIAGETLGWSFAHRARNGRSGADPQLVIFDIYETGGTLIQNLTTQSSAQGTNVWNVNAGSMSFAGTTGIKQLRFSTTNPGSYGNLLDDLQLDISAFAQLTGSTGSALEQDGDNIPAIAIYGRIDTITTLPVNITGGTANASDYTQTSASVTIPIGIYSGEEFALPIIITQDLDSEANETIEFTLGTPSTSEILYERNQCDGAPAIITATYTIINDDGALDVTKTSSPYISTGYDKFALPSNEVVYNITVANSGDLAVDSNSLIVVDTLPSNITFFNGDYDGAGPETDPVGFSQSGSSLTFSYTTDIGYAMAGATPTSMADCGYDPNAGYDPAVRFICFAPGGSLPAGDPDPNFSFEFLARIN